MSVPSGHSIVAASKQSPEDNYGSALKRWPIFLPAEWKSTCLSIQDGYCINVSVHQDTDTIRNTSMRRHYEIHDEHIR